MKLRNKVTLVITALLLIASTVLMAIVLLNEKASPVGEGILAGAYIGLLCLTAWLFGAGYLTPEEENIVVDTVDDITEKSVR